MKCPKCQFENPDDAQFCIECGNTIEFHCPKCGAVTPSTGKFCKACGHNLKEIKEPSSIDINKPKSYTPKYLADKILTNRSAIEGERKLVTVFFCDVANYTSISEKLDSEEVHQIMDGFFKILVDEIHRYEGTINQFTGDGIMAFFGAPIAHEDHAQRACYAALSIQKAVAEYGEKVEKETGIEFKMRVGMNSGQVMVGTIGDDLRMDYSALGDTTNLSARMEQAAKPGAILLSEATHKIVERYFEFNHLGKISIKGKEEPQNAYELVKTTEVTTRIEASAAKGLTRFVGRKKSTADLMEAWNKAKSASGQVVGIVGEAGVGKSRLLLEFRNKLSQKDCIFLQGQCLHYGSNMPYLPILDIVKACFGITEDDREYVIRKKIKDGAEGLDISLADTVTPFQELLSLKTNDETFKKLESKQKRDKTFEALRDLFLRLSEDKPVILAIEDLHWIDNTSQEFVDYLIGWIAAKPVLMILLYRPEYVHQWGSKSYYSRIGLDQLGQESSVDLIRAMLEGGEIVPELRDLILERASGNPLFMEEFTHSLQENGTIQKQNNRYVLSKNISELDVPETVQGIIAARMDRLEDNLKKTMQVASVIGRDFAYRILHRISGMKEELKSYLLNLQGLEFIFEKSLFPELEYIFKHALTRDVAYNSLLQKKRKEIHEKIGQAIEDLYSDRLEELYEVLAYHFGMSDNHAKTLEYLKLCIVKSEANYAVWEAFRYGQQAIKLLDQMEDKERNKREQLEVRFLMHGFLFNLAFPENSFEILQEGILLAKEAGDQRLIGFYNELSRYYTFTGDHDKAVEYSRLALEKAKESNDITWLANAVAILCMNIGFVYWLKDIQEIAPSVILTVEKALSKDDLHSALLSPYATLCHTHAWALSQIGNFEEAAIHMEKSYRAAKKSSRLDTIGFSAYYYATYYYYKGEIASAIAYGQKATEYFAQANMPSGFIGLNWCALGMVYHERKDYTTAKMYAEKALSILDEASLKALQSFPLVTLAQAVFELGDRQGAMEHLEEAMKAAKENGEIMWEGIVMYNWGHYYGRENPSEWKRAEKSIQEGKRIFYKLESLWEFAKADLFAGGMLLEARQYNRAKEYLTQAESSFRKMTCDYWADKAKKALDSL